MKKSPNIIGDNIKRLRKEKKLTQIELAKLIGKSESSIRKYEAGSVEPSFNTLGEIADKLNVDLIELTNKHYSSEEEMNEDGHKSMLIDSAIEFNINCSNFKELIHFFIQMDSFKNEFNIDYKKLSLDEKIFFKKELYSSIQYSCFKLKNYIDNNDNI